MRTIDYGCRQATICYKCNQWFKKYHKPKFASQNRHEKKGQKKIEKKGKISKRLTKLGIININPSFFYNKDEYFV